MQALFGQALVNIVDRICPGYSRKQLPALTEAQRGLEAAEAMKDIFAQHHGRHVRVGLSLEDKRDEGRIPASGSRLRLSRIVNIEVVHRGIEERHIRIRLNMLNLDGQLMRVPEIVGI